MAELFFGNSFYDYGLAGFKARNTKIHLCSAKPANFAGVAAVSLAYKADPVIGDPETLDDNGTDKRTVMVAAITDGVKTVETETVATHYAFVDEDTSDLQLVQALVEPRTVTPGGVWKCDASPVRIPME